MPLYTKKNWAKAKSANVLDETTDLLEVQLGHTLPKTGTFPLVIWNAISFPDPGNDPSVEILVANYIGVGSSGLDTYHIERAQDNTFANSHMPGSQIALNITAGVGYADLGILGTKEIDETGISDLKGVVYDSVSDKLTYKPIIPGLYDNDLNMFLLLGASNLYLYHVEFIAVVEYVNFVISQVDAVDDVLVWDEVEVSVDPLVIEAFDDVIVIEEDFQLALEELSASEDVLVFEEVEMSLDQLFSEISEDVFTDEGIETSLDELFTEMSDDVLVDEMTDFAGAIFEVSDDILAVEDLQLDLPIDFDVSDDILSLDEGLAGLDEMPFEFQDDVTIAEDLIVDLEVVAETSDDVTVAEDIVMEIACDVSDSDIVTVDESVEVFVDELNIEVFDDVAIVEESVMEFSEIELVIQDDLIVSEDGAIEIFEELNIDLFDEVTVAEGSAEEFSEIEMAVQDDLIVSEDSVMDLIMSLDGSDDIAVGEDFAYNVV